MSNDIFRPADILLPRNADMTRWSVVACDQYSSEPAYWEKAEKLVGDKPSTLRLMLPEAWLGRPESDLAGERIAAVMQEYLDAELLRSLPGSMIYVERRQSDGRLRRGLIGALDLEAYEYKPGSGAPVRATEGTVESRLPPRTKVRAMAPLEMPHVMVLMDDPDRGVIEPLADIKKTLDKLYDFDLMLGGGHIAGWLIGGAALARTEKALERLADPAVLERKYALAGAAPLLFAIGDGNHSLAAAKLCWEERKKALTEGERGTHPARFSLVELVNVHDEAVVFEPIHRVLFDTDAGAFCAAAEDFWRGVGLMEESGHAVAAAAGDELRRFAVGGLTIGQLIAAAEEFCGSFIREHGGRLDYIHGDETAAGMAKQPGSCALLLPAMNKSELFPSVIRSGPFPRKSFSIGHASDKRYYLECRRIR
jgi:hypothetical protein